MGNNNSTEDVEAGRPSNPTPPSARTGNQGEDVSMQQLSRGTTNGKLNVIGYARVLTQQIQAIQTPATIGMFLKSGKKAPFLLKYTESFLKPISKEQKSYGSKIGCFFIILLCLGIFVAAFVLGRFSSLSIENKRIAAIPLTAVLPLFIFWAIVKCFTTCGTELWIAVFAYFKVIPLTGFKSTHDVDQFTTKLNKSQSEIFINFQAWKYIGSHHFMNDICSNLIQNVENKFGKWTLKLFRKTSLKTQSDKSCDTECCQRSFNSCCPKLYESLCCCLLNDLSLKFIKQKGKTVIPGISLFVIWFIVYYGVIFLPLLFITTPIFLPDFLGNNDHNFDEKLLIAFIPPSAIFLYEWLAPNLLKIITSTWTYCSKRPSVTTINEVNFLQDLKGKVNLVTDLVNTANYVFDVQHKIVITIDGLDRIPVSKAKDILQSLNILLKEPNSPFVTIIVFNSNVVDKYFDDISNEPFRNGGYGCFKTFIDLPFSIPEKIFDDEKFSYIKNEIHQTHPVEENVTDLNANFKKIQKKFGELLYECRSCIEKDDVQCLDHSNLQHMKRLLSIVSVIASVACCDSTIENVKSLAERLVSWAVVLDQSSFDVRDVLKQITVNKNDDDASLLPYFETILVTLTCKRSEANLNKLKDIFKTESIKELLKYSHYWDIDLLEELKNGSNDESTSGQQSLLVDQPGTSQSF